MMSSSRTRIILVTSLALLCIVGLTLLLIFNETVRSVTLDPIIDGVLAFRYMLGYFPQDLEWLVSLLVLSVIVSVMFATRLPKNERPKYIPFIPPFPTEGPTMKLARILDSRKMNRFRRERVVLEMRDLAAHTLAYHKGISVEEAKESIDTPDWTDNAEVRDFLSLDKHRSDTNDPKDFRTHVEHASAHIEQMYQEV